MCHCKDKKKCSKNRCKMACVARNENMDMAGLTIFQKKKIRTLIRAQALGQYLSNNDLNLGLSNAVKLAANTGGVLS